MTHKGHRFAAAYISVIDISGSMSGAKIEAVRKSLIQTLQDFKMNSPSTKFFLIAFESSVYYYLRHDRETINFNGELLYSLEGMRELFKTIDTIKGRLNPSLETLGLLGTLYDQRSKINRQILTQARDYFQDLVFQTVIRMNVKLCEAPIYKIPITDYAQQSYGAVDYRELAQEVIARTVGSTVPACEAV